MNNTYKVKSGTNYTLDSKAYRLTEVKLTPNNSNNHLDI